MRSNIDDRRIRIVLIVLASLALVDCGGGGGGGGTPTIPTVPPNLSNATVPGTLDHGDTVTVSNGSNFGVKSPAAPVVLDSGSGLSPGAWSGAWPSQDPNFNTAYRPFQNGIGAPHPRYSGSNYIAGAHYSSAGTEAGYNVIFWRDRTIASYPAYTYASWYQRMQNNWVFGLGNPADDNLKAFAFSVCCSPYELPNNWYIEYNARPTSPGSGADWHINDDGASLENPDRNGNNFFWLSAVNPMSGVWTKIEVEIKYTNQSDGYIKLWENGAQKINYAGRTDNYPGNARTEGIGGYARSQGSANNWRYFAEVYLDYTPARVVLANNPTLSSATIVENQIPTAWSDTSITFVVNFGALPSGTAYLFVVNTAGLVNSSGFPVTVP